MKETLLHEGRLKLLRLDQSKKDNFARDVEEGLFTEGQKYMYPKYFYDDYGSALFEKICMTEDYYPTRTEAYILNKYSPEIAKLNNSKRTVVELGSGSSLKTEFLLSAFSASDKVLNYAPIDVSDILIESSERLLAKYGKLMIYGIISDYDTALKSLKEFVPSGRILLFLGSSIGNFSKEEAAEFLKKVCEGMSQEDKLIIGFDMVKDENVLYRAYNDSEGVTAEFNLNLLTRMNYELGAEFDLNKFIHEAVYNRDMERIEMRLISDAEQSVYIKTLNKSVAFTKGEFIHTENSQKFTDESILKLAKTSGFIWNSCWKDEKNYFSLCQFSRV